MRFALVLSTSLFAALAVSEGLNAGDKLRSITQADSVVAVYAENWELGSDGSLKMIATVWGDGHVVWSNAPVLGGPPYRSGKIEPAKFKALMARLMNDGFFSNDDLKFGRFGPDSRFTTIFVQSGDSQLKMQSWHELIECDGKTVATSKGVIALNHRKRFEMLAKEDPSYLRYRLAWEELRRHIADLKPGTSTPENGRLVMRKGDLTWAPQETP